MIILDDCEQGSIAWERARLGIPTASVAGQILTSGGAPKIPQHYRLAEKYDMPLARATKQREIVGALSTHAMLGHVAPLEDHEGSSSLKALIGSGTVIPCDPPPGTEPTRKPPQRSTQIDDLVDRCVAEWITGTPDEEWRGTHWTDRGQALEPQARAWFELTTGHSVESVGFVYRDEARNCGCSPDGIVIAEKWADVALTVPGPIGGLELKCPKLSTHLGYLRTPDEVPSAYWLQVQFSLWVSGLPRWWFMSWAGYPNVPPVLVEVEPDEATQTALDEAMPDVLGDIARRKAELLGAGVEPAEFHREDEEMKGYA